MSWQEYFEKMKGKPVRPLLKKALEIVPADYPKTAIDLGCGVGTDTCHMITQGWSVIAVEREADGVNYLKSQLSAELADKLSIMNVTFENIDKLPKASLVYASLSLPFYRPDKFHQFWRVIESSFSDECVFAANFFGSEDDWVLMKKCVGHTEQEIRSLLKEFEIVEFHEKNEMGSTALGPEKHWHIFTVIAKK